MISGRFKGVALATPKTGTRPTTDRTKEAIFSHLDSWGVLEDARVLDLFAGTGALGIEALSRGAKELVAVESSRPMAALLAKTLKQLQSNNAWLPDMRARVLTGRAEQVVTGFGQPFDVVMIDPPYVYETEECDRLLDTLASGGATNAANAGTIIMLERSTRSDDPTAPDGWEITDRRNYGETAVFYIEPAES